MPPASTPSLRAQAEAYLADANPATDPALPTDALLHELRVHQIELEMQNVELRAANTALEEVRDLYVDLYEFAPVGYLTLSNAGFIQAINLAGAHLLGRDRAEILNRRFAHFVAPEDFDRWHRFFIGALKEQSSKAYFKLQCKDAPALYTLIDYKIAKEASGSLGLRIAITDVTERVKAENELKISALAFDSRAGIMVTDAHGLIIRVNRAFSDMTGYEASEVIGRNPSVLNSGIQDQAFYQDLWMHLKVSGTWEGEISNRHKKGHVIVEWLVISAVTDVNGSVINYLGSFYEITQKKAAEAEIQRLAFFDPLTALANRRLLVDRIQHAMVVSQRSKKVGAIILLDLDGFKSVNDTQGHSTGDTLLVSSAQRIQGAVRAGDTVARMGGDEFVILLEELGDNLQDAAISASVIGEKVREALEAPYDFDGHKSYCTASIGISLFLAKEESLDTVLKHADVAMYRAKQSGRNCVRLFDAAMQHAIDERFTSEISLRNAIEQGQLELHYQPLVDNIGKIFGAEALLRWNRPIYGLTYPGTFISLAEESDLIILIGQWVIETAFEQLVKWATSDHTRDLVLSVNVSVKQFKSKTFLEHFQSVMTRSKIDPTRLKIEITESLLIDDLAGSAEKIKALKADGVKFSLDDFGTGYSSLMYLKHLQLDQLKIDRSFIRDIDTDENDRAIVQTIIGMGKILKLNVIAEGVETRDQFEILKTLGCNQFQGFLFSKALTIADFSELFARTSSLPGGSVLRT